jgi:2-(3-amino-3-carboxypropyl)histidine synthase
MEPSKPRRRFRGKQHGGSSSKREAEKMDAASSQATTTTTTLTKSKETTSFWKRRAVGIQIPQYLLENPLLEKMVSQFPKHYDLEIHKTIWRIRQLGAQRVALQIPEGLLLYGCLLSDIFERFCDVETIILGDVNYGACCVDDFTGRLHGVDLLVHYGHSCLVPVSKCSIPILYVFVEIEVDVDLFVKALTVNLSSKLRIVLISTIQFVSGLRAALPSLQDHFSEVMIPQDRPLSKGEILGCTSPVVPERFDAVISLSDGRFHLESMMISNPSLTAYRFDPYSLTLTKEMYDIERMKLLRW